MSTQIKNKLKPSIRLREILNKYHFIPKKKLGQHFMIDEETLNRVVHEADISKKDLVIEIGTGTGFLTEKLAQKAGQVISIEYDKILFEIAKDILKNYKNVELVREDFLKFDIQSAIKKYPKFKNYKVVANLPYYITSLVISKLIGIKPTFCLAVLTVQREVAERMVAKCSTKSYGSFSIFIQYYLEPEIISYIPKSAFIPHPSVSSAIVKLKPKKNMLNVRDKDLFFDIVHAAFEHRRKTIKNALMISRKFKFTQEKLEEALKRANINPERRGETLSIEEFMLLSNLLCLSS